MSIAQRLKNNIFVVINKLTARIAALEHQVMLMQADMQRQIAIQRQHMVRLKNGEKLADDFLLNGHAYYDLSPEQAWKIFQDPNVSYVLLDVSHATHETAGKRPELALRIPLEELAERWDEVPAQGVRVLVISEDGLRSILACDYLVSRGYFHCSNISGGWKFWPGHRLHEVVEESKASA